MSTGAERFDVAGPAGRVSALHWPGPAEATGVLLLHPVNTAARVWEEVAPLLNRPVVAVDYRGHGGSEPGDSYLPADFAADALAVLDKLGWPRVHLAGGSIGGAVAVELAAMMPDRVASIGAFGATLHIGTPADELDATVAGLRELGVDETFRQHGRLIVGSRALPGSADRFVELGGGRDLQVVVEIVRTTFGVADARPAAGRLPKIPALVAVGTEDPTCPVAMAAELAGYLATEVRLIEGIGHLPMVEAPDEVAELLRELQQS